MLGRVVAVAALIFAISTPVLAEPQSSGIDKREHKQKERINQGVESGQLTKKEARRLRHEQKRIKAKEEAMKLDGTLTKGERKELQQDLNKASEHIAEQKHDAQTR